MDIHRYVSRVRDSCGNLLTLSLFAHAENNKVLRCAFPKIEIRFVERISIKQDSKPGAVDLHGLYVKEAIRYADRAIQEARERGDAKLNIIVGQLPYIYSCCCSIYPYHARP